MVLRNIAYMTTTPTFGIRELAEKAKKEGAIDLAQGVIDANPPKVLLDTLRSLPLEQYSRYNNKRGVPEYREAMASYLSHRNWNVSVDSVMAIAGSVGGTAGAILTHARPGATVILPEPFFIGHKLLLESLGFVIRFFPTPLDSEPDWNALESAMKDADAFLLTTPANPTGVVATPDRLARFSKVAKETNCLLVIDDMYREFIWGEEFDDSEYANIDFTTTILLRSFSKTLAIPGWRTGFAVTSPERVEAMATVHDSLYLGGSTIGQYALAHTFSNSMSEIDVYVSDLRAMLLRNHSLLEEAFTAYGMNPLPVPGAYYMIIKHNRESDMVAMEELIAKKVVTTPVNILFSDTSKDTGYIRAHFACSEEHAKQVADILKA